MRLICPNCGAQYEVPDDVIPAEGRDVQCSNCSSTWFQPHPDHDSKLADELDDPSIEPVAPPPEPAEQAEDAPAAETEPEQKQFAQRDLDPDVADVLREEAELERTAREADRNQGLESQPDLGLDNTPADEAARRAEQARNRMARMRGQTSADEAAVAAAAAAAGSRRDLLPDIEEINSTLRSSGERRKPAEATDTDLPKTKPKIVRKGRSFRRGFFGMILIAALAIAAYVFGPQVSKAVPAAEPYVAKYTAEVETARGWFATSVERGLAWLDQLASENLGTSNDG